MPAPQEDSHHSHQQPLEIPCTDIRGHQATLRLWPGAGGSLVLLAPPQGLVRLDKDGLMQLLARSVDLLDNSGTRQSVERLR
ncbi:hypothetical protein SAMN05444320_104368 [Streptoalloteichus hindustanus]|uniref:Uncharacterized protein n=1 Tax=Streptoalloteichus hindustanus TaxID=2017 RepID=A0A1M5DAD9_STRHI|nr:hypothetical protein SAMN05444320_104368 [Streptoalloteichus hindustanus]